MPKNSLKNRFRSDLIRNSSILISGSVIGQGIALLSYLILTRLFSKSDFGVLSTFQAAVGLLALFATGRYEESLVIAKNQKETTSLFGFSLKLLFVVSSIIFLLLLFFRNFFFTVFRWEEIKPFWLYIPFAVFFLGLFDLLTNLATREKQFKRIASARLTQSLVGTVSKLAFGFLSFTGIGLILSHLISYIGGNSLFLFSSLKKQFKAGFQDKWNEQKAVALKYKDFPTYNLGRTFISGFSTNLPFLVLISFFGTENTGLYSLAWTLLYSPVYLIADALYSTLFENTSSSERNKKPVLPSLKKYWKALCTYILPLFILAFLIAKPFFRIAFGWEESAVYFQYLLPWMFLLMMTSPVHFIPIIFNKQNMAFIIEIIYLIFRLAALIIGIYLMNFKLSILLFCGVGFVFTLILLIWFYSLLSKYEKQLKVES